MTWQEYQEAAAVFYEQADGVGTIERGVQIPDRITGQNRQVDALLTVETKGHTLRVLIDAKFHADPIDVKVVEEVAALADAVGACKSFIVCANGWTEPAGLKAKHLSCDLTILTLEDALELMVPDKWMLCPSCERDCIVLDQDGAIQTQSGMWIWWLAGACRECRHLVAWCQDCGDRYHLKPGETLECYCGYVWGNDAGKLSFCIEKGAEVQ